MGEIVNLRQARKAKARAAESAASAENRARHGATKSERSARKAEGERAAALLDGARRD